MDTFRIGAVYVLEQEYTRETMQRDLSNMRACGFDTVTLWPVANAHLAPNPTAFVFAQTRLCMDLCHALGLSVILQLFGQNQAMEFMPDAVLTEDMCIMDERGASVNANCFWANLNHPAVRQAMDAYFKACMEEFRDHPALLAWDVFNEAHFRSDDAYTIAAYQDWLRKKYGSIQTLNTKWYRRYADFSQISPRLRRSSYSIWSSLLPDVEYEQFRSENLNDICAFLVETARKYDGAHPLVLDGTSSHILCGDVTQRNNDEFTCAHLPDVYGATFYPKSWGKDYRQRPWTMAMYYAVPASAAQAAGKPYWVNELQTHTQSALTPGSEVSPEELKSWMLMTVFTGAQALQLWRWRPFLHGYQSTGRGLTGMDGSVNARADAAREIAELLHREPLFANARVCPPHVRIAVSYRSRLFFDSLLKWGESHWAQDVEGWYKAFWTLGENAAFCDAEALTRDDLASPVLVLPAMVSLSERACQTLKAYVENGGVLVADARLRALDEWGVVPEEGLPGATLSQVFGLVETDVAHDLTFTEGSEAYSAPFMSQLVQPAPDAQVPLTNSDGSPALVRHAFGKGCTFYFTCMAGMGWLTRDGSRFADMVLKAADCPAALTVEKPIFTHFAQLESEQERALLLCNSAPEPAKVHLHGLPEGVQVRRYPEEDCFYAKKNLTLELPGASYCVLLYPKH